MLECPTQLLSQQDAKKRHQKVAETPKSATFIMTPRCICILRLFVSSITGYSGRQVAKSSLVLATSNDPNKIIQTLPDERTGIPEKIRHARKAKTKPGFCNMGNRTAKLIYVPVSLPPFLIHEEIPNWDWLPSGISLYGPSPKFKEHFPSSLL